MSSGGSGSTTTTQTQSLPPWLTGAAQDYLGAAGQVAQLPYQPYMGQRVADLSPVQQQSIQNISDLSAGTPSMYAAEGMLNDTLSGRYMGGNPGLRYGYTPDANPYGGLSNPYFDSTLRSGLSDITDAYNRGTSADTTRMFNLAGAFGGSAHQQAIANNERELGRTLANYEGAQRSGQYDRAAQLAESGIGRSLQNAQFGAQLGQGAFEGERNRMMGAVNGATGLYGSLMNGLGTALQAGGIERSQQQDLLGSQYQDFMDWRNYPDSRINLYGNALGAVTGAAPRTSTTNQGLPPPDRVSQGLGALALGNYISRGSSK